eukprot:CAMPEP_0173383208 /NCGR_PEP_ID=MMETSP1356-20130122/5751_1 /TAXON_ID=77927 ORGANISM="Hemiselmis virescens, Strain PCC157" /NCGR_SAMPLE_ID=MMETSP1356 /ASSEMBLY_ACC=CAM_ASM_000847 /LENGTH=301 /DNA_ID=CAMNT_0014337951 /DNA_START=129 /DNA_END=1034 /DNA_ORIENTATION=-
MAAAWWQEASAFSVMPGGHQLPKFAGGRQVGSALTQAAMVVTGTSKLGKALKKPTGALTVGFEAASSLTSLGDSDLITLSLTLRKNKASAIFCDPAVVAAIAKEQAKAKGNFPGPCPVISLGGVTDEEELAKVQSTGANGVVFSVAKLGHDTVASLAEAAAAKGMDAVWEVASEEEAKAAVEAGAKVILVSASTSVAAAIREVVPKEVVAVARVESMQQGANEVTDARSLKAAGFNSVMLSEACVGDKEDAVYAKWAVEALTSKQSKEFKITGMTGHVNGHYGTGTFEKSQAEVVWLRKTY